VEMDHIKAEVLGQKVHKALKAMIMSGELRPGQKLVQDDLAERLGVSRTPLLAAFLKLEQENLVVTIPRRGAFVNQSNDEDHASDAGSNLSSPAIPLPRKKTKMTMKKVENQALFELVYERIKKMINGGEMQGGEKINKKTLSELLGVSQTPINEALSKLAGEKILEQRSREGFFIHQYTNPELSRLFELRASIEGMAARLCAENMRDEEVLSMSGIFEQFSLPLPERYHPDYLKADKLFHESLVQYSGNPFLVEIFITSGYQPKIYQKGLLRSAEETLPEHLMIMNALKNRDAHLAQELTIVHLLRTRDLLRTM